MSFTNINNILINKSIVHVSIYSFFFFFFMLLTVKPFEIKYFLNIMDICVINKWKTVASIIMQIEQNFFLDLEKLIRCSVSAVIVVLSNPLLDFHQELRYLSFFLLSIYTAELLPAPKIIAFLLQWKFRSEKKWTRIKFNTISRVIAFIYSSIFGLRNSSKQTIFSSKTNV